MYHVIMAGGIGSRFWPMSTEHKPKQFLNLLGNKSLIKSTYDRLLKISDPEKIFIVTSEKYKDHIKEQIPNVDNHNIIYEPKPKNTAPAIYLALKHLCRLETNPIVGVYPSDHYIQHENKFYEAINKVIMFINNNKKSIVTLGIKPEYPSTGYGYINIRETKDEINKVNKFIEKPNLDKAKSLIKDSNNLWNSGMFFFRLETMINEIDKYIPEINELFLNFDTNDINDIWDSIPSKSIDYGVMEKTDLSYCIKSSIGWSDVGTWFALYDLLEKDKFGNAIKGNVVVQNSSNNLIISDNEQISIIGLDNMAIICVKNKTLVIDLSKSEDVKHLIKSS